MIEIHGKLNPDFEQILTKKALDFISTLERQFRYNRERLLQNRKDRQAIIDVDISNIDFHNDLGIRNADWKISNIPKDLLLRRVEITGPTDRKMIINALNSGADCFMTDFEDSNSPTWTNLIQGHINLKDAVNRTISLNSAGKNYQLNEKIATLLVRPRGLHLNEKHIYIDHIPMSASLFDFGLYFYHNVHKLIENGTGPYFYLPKMQSHLEAQWWNEVFVFAQQLIGIPTGTIKCTVLIEHILAAFECEEILHELKDHIVGLNCGRWDYIFSIIKTFSKYPEFVFPDRSQVTMATPCMEAYCKEVIRACHKRGAYAMGGMAAQIPIKNDPVANEVAMEKVRLDKEREVKRGHDATWVAHPGLIGIAMKAFENVNPNQINYKITETITKEQLLETPKGTITDEGLRHNIRVGVQYLEAWIRGNGCVPIYNLMEDCATVEISKSQIWQWIWHEASTNDNQKITLSRFKQTLQEELSKIKSEVGEEVFDKGSFGYAADLFDKIISDPQFTEFLSIPAYKYLD